jgi:hypothetical protein
MGIVRGTSRSTSWSSNFSSDIRLKTSKKNELDARRKSLKFAGGNIAYHRIAVN